MTNQCKTIIALVLVFIIGIGIGYSISNTMYDNIVKAKVQELKAR
jgi:uncharacterized membrane protein